MVTKIGTAQWVRKRRMKNVQARVRRRKRKRKNTRWTNHYAQFHAYCFCASRSFLSFLFSQTVSADRGIDSSRGLLKVLQPIESEARFFSQQVNFLSNEVTQKTPFPRLITSGKRTALFYVRFGGFFAVHSHGRVGLEQCACVSSASPCQMYDSFYRITELFLTFLPVYIQHM